MARGGDQRIPRPPGTRPGADPPWAGAADPALLIAEDRIRARLRHLPRPSRPVRIPGQRMAAVLIPLYSDGGEVGIVFVKRPWSARTHKGEIAFPGGMRHREDPDLAATALREAEEETGIRPEQVEVLGELDSFDTVSSRAVLTPFVGWVSSVEELRPNPGEIAAVLRVPLSELIRSDTYRAERWGVGPLSREVHFFEIEGETIWGATGHILRHLLDFLLVEG